MKNVDVLMQELQNGLWDNRLAEIYAANENEAEAQGIRYQGALKRYVELFGAGDVEVYSAPGRTEIGGNHTDHQHGMVLAASVNLDTVAVAGYNRKNRIELVSEGYEPVSIDIGELEVKESEYGTTAALIRGMAKGMKEHGHEIGPFKAYVTSNVLNGAGLSSSAAFETVIGTIFSGLFNQGKVSPVEIAILGQYAENVYFGKPCGLMDQMASSVGSIVFIDFKNPGSPVVEKMEYDMGKKAYSLCIVDTKGSHADLTDDYARIPAEMKEVAGLFGCKVLREVPEEAFFAKLPEIYAKTSNRAVLRAIHFFQENERVNKEAEALRTDDFGGFLQLVKESGDSSFKYLQNIYSNHDEHNQPIAVGLAVSEKILQEKGVCRVHGGGFAGTIQAFVKNEFVSEYKKTLEGIFGEGACHVLKIRKYGGLLVM